MSLDTWRALIDVALELHAEGEKRSAPEAFRTRFVWHGGEPLLLPRSYYDAVLALQREAFGMEALEQGKVRNSMQSNLYKCDFELVRHLAAQGFSFGISHDFVPGLRRTASGLDSSERVTRNLERLEALGIEAGIITVVASHNLPHLEAIYGQARDMGRHLRFLPFAEGNGAADMSRDACHPKESVEALVRVFRIWFGEGCPIGVDPLDECLRIVTMKWLGLEHTEYERDRGLDSVLVVELDGSVHQSCEATASCAPLGNVRIGSWRAIRNSEGYRQSLARDRAVLDTTCGGCPHRGACDGYPALRFNAAAAARGECPIVRPLVTRIEEELSAFGVSPIDLGPLLAAWA